MRVRSKLITAKSQAHIPSEEDMALINRLALTPLAPEEVYVRSVFLCNGEVDRDYEQFSRPVLEEFARSIVGKALLIGHRHDSAPEGLFYKAEVIDLPSSEFGIRNSPMADRNVCPTKSPVPAVKAYFYMVTTQENEHLRRQIDGGVLRYVSIGFRCETLTCDLCHRSIYDPNCPHIPGRDYEGRTCTSTWEGPAEAVEGSIVFLGSQYGAEIVKRRGSPQAARCGELRGASCEHGCDVLDAQVKTLRALLREREDEVARLRPLAKDGERLRGDLIAEIHRLANIMGEEPIAGMLDLSLCHAELDDLQEVLRTYRARVEAKFPPRPHSQPGRASADLNLREIEPFAV